VIIISLPNIGKITQSIIFSLKNDMFQSWQGLHSVIKMQMRTPQKIRFREKIDVPNFQRALETMRDNSSFRDQPLFTHMTRI